MHIMKKNLFRKALLVAGVGVISVTAFAQQEKVIKIFDQKEKAVKAFRAAEVNYVQVDDLTEVEVPGNLQVTVYASPVTISWNAVAGATEYNVYRSADNSSFDLLRSGLTATTFTDNAPLTGASYYKVSAIKDGLESNLSGSASASLYPSVKSFTVNGVTFNMILVNGGTYQMGTDNGSENEKPVHDETVSSFYIGQTEVTQELWTAVMGTNPAQFQGANMPVERVSFKSCEAFITKLNALTGETFRIPSEAEWEYAARGGDKSKGYTYSGSNIVSDVAWHLGNSSGTTHPVGTKAPNELGIYDMSGNVREWTTGFYSESYDAEPDTSQRVSRGGCWSHTSANSRVTYRNANALTSNNNGLGLRIVL